MNELDIICKCGHYLKEHNIDCCGKTNIEKGIICDLNFHCVCLADIDEKCWCKCGCSCTRKNSCQCSKYRADNLTHVEQLAKQKGLA